MPIMQPKVFALALEPTCCVGMAGGGISLLGDKSLTQCTH